jgi:multicomponent Na+:H+ antiporter subunit B
MIKRAFSLALVVLLAAAFFPMLAGIQDLHEVGPLAQRYLSEGPEALGAANLVTAVVVTYRGLDTLGEVTVLFAAAAGVALVFSQLGRHAGAGDPRRLPSDTGVFDAEASAPAAVHKHRQAPSELIETGAGLLLPLILLFGVFIFLHGHLTPGGGFQGGVIIASGVLLTFLAGTLEELSHRILGLLEMLAGVGYVAVGLLGLWLAAGFLDPRFLPAGDIGGLFSAGAIPIIYSLVGIKVGAELSGVIDAMRQRSVAR